MKKSKLKELVEEVLNELSATGGEGFLSPFAFSKEGQKNRATKFLEKSGYTTVKLPKRPYHTKLIDYLDENTN